MTVKVPHPLRVVAVSGGMQRPSKSVALAEHLLALIAEQLPCERHLVEIGALAPQFAGAPWRSHLPGSVEQALALVEQADVLVVATPVYRGSFTGLFKHFFDFIDQDALVDTPVLLAATGGSDRHALMIDHQLRPLFSFPGTHLAAGRLRDRPGLPGLPRAQPGAGRASQSGSAAGIAADRTDAACTFHHRTERGRSLRASSRWPGRQIRRRAGTDPTARSACRRHYHLRSDKRAFPS